MKVEKMRNSKHTKEFRDSTVQLIINSNEKVVKIADDLDINVKTLYHWISEYKKANGISVKTATASIKSVTKETMNDELKRLRKENKILKQERDILKKATAYFAKETL
jgi:transposase